MAKSRIEIEGDALENQADADLATKAAQGDREAFEELYRRHARTAMRVAYRITGNIHDASDAVSDAFARVMQALPKGQLAQPTRFRPYLMTATRHAAVDVLRRAGRTVPAASDEALEPAQTVAGPSERLIDATDSALVATAFRNLPERWRSVLWLTEVEQVPAREAAPMLGLSPNGVAQLAVRARAGLRERYLQAHLREVDGECREIVERLGAYVGGGLPPREVASVDQHVAGCEACRGREGEVREIGTTLRRALVPMPAVGSGATALVRWLWRLADRAHHAAARVTVPGTDQALSRVVPVGVAAAGVFVAGLAGAGMVSHRVTAGRTPTAVVVTPSTSAEPPGGGSGPPSGAAAGSVGAPAGAAVSTSTAAAGVPDARVGGGAGSAADARRGGPGAGNSSSTPSTVPSPGTGAMGDHKAPPRPRPVPVPTTLPGLPVDVPTTVPGLPVDVPTTLPLDTSTTLPAVTDTTLPSLPTTIPGVTDTTVPSLVDLASALGAADIATLAFELAGSDAPLPSPEAPGMPV